MKKIVLASVLLGVMFYLQDTKNAGATIMDGIDDYYRKCHNKISSKMAPQELAWLTCKSYPNGCPKEFSCEQIAGSTGLHCVPKSRVKIEKKKRTIQDLDCQLLKKMIMGDIGLLDKVTKELDKQTKEKEKDQKTQQRWGTTTEM